MSRIDRYSVQTFQCSVEGCKAKTRLTYDVRVAAARGWQILHPVLCPKHNDVKTPP